MNGARDFACRNVRTALGLERTRLAVMLARKVDHRAVLGQPVARLGGVSFCRRSVDESLRERGSARSVVDGSRARSRPYDRRLSRLRFGGASPRMLLVVDVLIYRYASVGDVVVAHNRRAQVPKRGGRPDRRRVVFARPRCAARSGGVSPMEIRAAGRRRVLDLGDAPAMSVRPRWNGRRRPHEGSPPTSLPS